MRLVREDWKKLRATVIFFSLSLLAMLTLVYFTHLRKEISKLALDDQKTQLEQATKRYRLSGAEKNNIIKYLPQYQQLISTGVVGEERRLEWVDALRNIHKKQKLFTIKYGIGAQEAYKPVFNINVGQFKISRSMMKLELAMLHEGDLLTLLAGFAEQKTSPFILRQCEITRQNANIGNSLTPNMQAKCELDWITIHEPINVATEVSVTSNQLSGERP